MFYVGVFVNEFYWNIKIGEEITYEQSKIIAIVSIHTCIK